MLRYYTEHRLRRQGTNRRSSLEHNHTGRTIYLAGAGADEFVASDPAMDFGYAMRTELKPMPEIGMRGPVGWWIVLGEAGGGAVADVLREHGAEAHQLEPAGYPDIRKLASGSSEVIWAGGRALFLQACR